MCFLYVQSKWFRTKWIMWMRKKLLFFLNLCWTYILLWKLGATYWEWKSCRTVVVKFHDLTWHLHDRTIHWKSQEVKFHFWWCYLMSSKSNLGHFFFFPRPMLQAVMWLFFSVDLRVFRSFLVLSMATKRSAVLTVVIQMARYNYEVFFFLYWGFMW